MLRSWTWLCSSAVTTRRSGIDVTVSTVLIALKRALSAEMLQTRQPLQDVQREESIWPPILFPANVVKQN
jgi:hypothetical protein